MAAMAKVRMEPGSGPEGADRMVADYKQAYLLQVRANLVDKSEIGIMKAMYEYKDKLPPELNKYIIQLPEDQQPRSIQMLHEAMRNWAEIEREGQPKSSH